jgi:hypothetical protein
MLLHEIDALFLDPPPHATRHDAASGADSTGRRASRGEEWEGERGMGQDLEGMVRGLEDMMLQLSSANTRVGHTHINP